MPRLILDLGHTILGVRNMREAVKFYRDQLGFRVAGKVSPVWTVVELKGGRITLWKNDRLPAMALGPAGRETPFHFHVRSFGRVADRLASLGVRVERDDAHAGRVWDPSGNVLALHDHEGDE